MDGVYYDAKGNFLGVDEVTIPANKVVKNCTTCRYNDYLVHWEEPCFSCNEKKTPENEFPNYELATRYKEKKKKDVVNHPDHYETGKFECFDVMEEVFGTEAVKNFCLCNAFKYLYRCKRKNGLEDLKKAQWYLEKLISKGGIK